MTDNTIRLDALINECTAHYRTLSRSQKKRFLGNLRVGIRDTMREYIRSAYLIRYRKTRVCDLTGRQDGLYRSAAAGITPAVEHMVQCITGGTRLGRNTVIQDAIKPLSIQGDGRKRSTYIRPHRTIYVHLRHDDQANHDLAEKVEAAKIPDLVASSYNPMKAMEQAMWQAFMSD
jgi:hypothetical protein